MKITIFWFAGSGTSTVWKILAKKLWYTFMSTGNIFREFAKEVGLDLYEFEATVAKHDDNFDKKLDKKSQEYGKEYNNFVFESRLAWHFIPDSFKIYLDCEQKERYRRIHERENGNIEDITSYNSRREKELEERYKKVYPNISFPPQKDSFDLYIDSTKILPEDIVKIIIESLDQWNSTS